MQYESAFLIGKTDLIINKLQILFKKKCLLTVHYGYDDKIFITTILHLNLVDNILVFYHSPKQDEIRELLSSDKITFKADYLGIKIAFDTHSVNKYKYDGLSVFSIPIPKKLLWIEARDYFRIKTLDSLPGYFYLTIKPHPEPFKFKIFDMSIAGFSILIDSQQISNLMIPTTYFETGKISLEQTGEGSISFEVRSKCLLNPDDPIRIEKIGCQFTQITSEFEDIIHLYMGKIERENRQNNSSFIK
jgi:flagellar brake protein